MTDRLGRKGKPPLGASAVSKRERKSDVGGGVRCTCIERKKKSMHKLIGERVSGLILFD